MSSDKKQEFEFKELLEYRKSLFKTMEYSVRRIDLLIIALSTSGILICVQQLTSNPGKSVELKWAILFFTLSIVINLISQFIGYYAARELAKVWDEKVEDYKDNPENYDDSKYESRITAPYKFGTMAMHFSNIMSFLLLVIGMVSALLYYYCHF